MPPHCKPTLEEQLAEAQAALKAANKEKAKLAAALAKETTAKRKLIPRPKGQAGKGSGYNLLEKMRLAQNKTRYNRLMNIPIRAFLKQYLANNHDKHKRAVRQERAAEEQDTDDWSAAAQDGENGEDVDDANSDPENDDIELDTKDEDDGDVEDGDADDDLDAILEDKDMNFDPLDLDDLSIGDDSSPKKSRKSVKENVAPNLKGDSGDVKGKTKLKSTSVSPVKRKSTESPTDTAMPAKKKAKTSDARSLKPFTDADIPQECPDTHCSDSVPRPLPPALFSLFAQKHALPLRRNWSLNITERKPENKGGRYSYGPMGQSVILNALEHSFGADDNFPLEPDLYATISPLIDKSQNWDEFDDASNLISFKKFTKFILIPAVATNLIAEDLECDLKDALDILEDSRRCGEVLHADQPRENIDVYATPQTDEASAPPRLRKKVSLILPAQKKITLDDFPPPPEVKTKPKKDTPMLQKDTPVPAKLKPLKGKPTKHSKA
ncbi:hypothetical protein B0H19DRAFT_1371471 [Mycena capillaripes]|nr:hypothetical protein B0H19DRAFT_1371471 [Mycena capillaripes]